MKTNHHSPAFPGHFPIFVVIFLGLTADLTPQPLNAAQAENAARAVKPLQHAAHADSPDSDGNRQIPPATKAEIARLQSPDIRQRADAVMRLRYLGMRGEATAAVPYLIRMLRSDTEFPRMVLYCSSLAPVTQSCSDEYTFGGEAAETLGQIGEGSDDLLSLLENENWRIRANAIRALGGLKDGRAIGPLLAIVQRLTEHWEVKGNAALALGLMGEHSAAPKLIEALKDQHAAVRMAAAAALGQLACPEALEPLCLALRDPNPRVRCKVAGSLGCIKAAKAEEALIGALDDPDRVVREVAAWALSNAEGTRAVRALITALKDEYANVQINAASALGELRPPEALEPLLGLLGNNNEAVRAAAATALGNLEDPRATEKLIDMVRAEERQIPLVRGLEALTKLGHRATRIALEECRRHRPDWIEWWRRNRDELLDRENSTGEE